MYQSLTDKGWRVSATANLDPSDPINRSIKFAAFFPGKKIVRNLNADSDAKIILILRPQNYEYTSLYSLM